MKTLNVKLKKTVIFSLFVLSGLFLIQCNNSNEFEEYNFSILKNATAGFTKISGYVHNRDFYPNTKDIIITLSHISGESRVTEIKTPINDDGTFYFEIDLGRSQDVAMHPYLDFLYLIPGDSLHVELDFKNLRQYAQLSGGKSVAINHDFFKYFDATGYRTTRLGYRGVGTDCEINCSWVEIRKRLDEERNNYRKRRQEFLQKNKVCEEVMFLTEAMIELDYYGSLVGTIYRRENTFNETMDKESLMNEINEIAVKYFNSELYSDTHFKFIRSAYMPATRFRTNIHYDWNKGLDADWIEEVTKTDVIKDFMFTVQAGSALLQKDLNSFEKNAIHVNNEYLLDRLTQEYKITRTKMRNPENISAYILGGMTDISNYVSFDDNNFLAETITPNYGKVQIINICASWCPPCKIVLGQLATLMKEYAGKDVSFSFICMTPDNIETREMYRERGINDKTVHFTTEDEYHFISTTFTPMVFPYGILVNKKGVIVDYGTHVRPSELLSEKINLLLEQDKLIK